MTPAHIAAATGALCYILVVVFFFALHVVGRGRSIIAHAVSDYGVGRTSRLFIIYGVIGCIGAASLAVTTALTDAAAYPLRVPVYLAALSILRIGVLQFRTDLEGAAVTTEGRWHYAFAIATFALTYMAVDAAGPPTEMIAPAALAGPLAALGWIAAVSLTTVVVTLLPKLRHVFGLAERIFLLSTALWLLCLGVILAQAV